MFDESTYALPLLVPEQTAAPPVHIGFADQEWPGLPERRPSGPAVRRLREARRRYDDQVHRVSRKVTRLFAKSVELPPDSPSTSEFLKGSPHELRARAHTPAPGKPGGGRTGRKPRASMVNRFALSRLRAARTPATPAVGRDAHSPPTAPAPDPESLAPPRPRGRQRTLIDKLLVGAKQPPPRLPQQPLPKEPPTQPPAALPPQNASPRHSQAPLPHVLDAEHRNAWFSAPTTAAPRPLGQVQFVNSGFTRSGLLSPKKEAAAAAEPRSPTVASEAEDPPASPLARRGQSFFAGGGGGSFCLSATPMPLAVGGRVTAADRRQSKARLGVTGLEVSIDLSDHALTPADLYLLCHVLGSASKAKVIDLSGNDLSSLQEYRLLYDLLQHNNRIVDIRLHRTKMPVKWRRELQRQLQANAAMQQERSNEKAEQDLLMRQEAWREAREAARDKCFAAERDARKAIATEQLRERRDLLAAIAASNARIAQRAQRREQRRRNLAALADMRGQEQTQRNITCGLYIRSMWDLMVRADATYRDAVMVEQSAARAILRSGHFEGWRLARKAETLRLEQERMAREALEGAETYARSQCESDTWDATTRMYQLERRHLKWVSAQLRERRDLQASEHGARSAIEADQLEKWQFINDRKQLEIQQHGIRQMLRRREFEIDEERRRMIFIAEEERMRPILEEILTSYRQFVDVCAAYEHISTDRTDFLTEPPLVALSQPADVPLPRFVTGQPENSWTHVDTRMRFVCDMQSNFEELCQNIREKELRAWQMQQAQVERQKDIRQKHKEMLSSGEDRGYLLDMISNAVDDMERGSTAAANRSTPADPTRWPDLADLRRRKLRIWGGRVGFEILESEDVKKEWAELDELQHPYVKSGRCVDVSAQRAARSPLSPVALAAAAPGSPARSPRSVGPSGPEEPVPCTGVQVHLGLPMDGSCNTAEVLEVLQGLTYRTQLKSGATKKKPIVRSIRVTVALHFAQCSDVAQLRTDEEPPDFAEVTVTKLVHLVVLPPLFFIEGDPSLQWSEGDAKMLQTPLLREVRTVRPWTIARRGDEVIIAEGAADAHFKGGKIVLDFASGHTPDDYIGLRSGKSVNYVERGDPVIRVDGGHFGTVTAGTLLRASEMNSGQHVSSSGKHVEIDLVSEVATADNLRKVLDRLRFWNVSRDPIIGVRTVHVNVIDELGVGAEVRVSVEVDATDDPAELTLRRSHIMFHANYSTVIEECKSKTQRFALPVFGGCDLVDADTDHFVGGRIKVQCSNMQRGDTINLLESCLNADPEEAVDQIVVVQGPVGPTVWYGGHEIGNLHVVPADAPQRQRAGSLSKKVQSVLHIPAPGAEEAPPDQPGDGSTSAAPSPAAASLQLHSALNAFSKKAGAAAQQSSPPPAAQTLAVVGSKPEKLYKELTLDFNRSGHATIAAAQLFLRSVVFFNSSSVPSMASTRLVTVTVKLGPTVFKETVDGKKTTIDDVDPEAEGGEELKESVHIRCTPSLIGINPKLAVIKYTEGTGPQRLPAFDVVAEIHTDAYDGGSILVEIVDGHHESDVLNIREEGITVTLREWVDVHADQDALEQYKHPGEARERKTDRKRASLAAQAKKTGAGVLAAMRLTGPLSPTAASASSDSPSAAQGSSREGSPEPEPHSGSEQRGAKPTLGAACGRLRAAARELAQPLLGAVAAHLREGSDGEETQLNLGGLVSELRSVPRRVQHTDRSANAGPGMVSVSDLMVDTRPLGVVIIDRCSGTMGIYFHKTAHVRRRDVITLLRNLTYLNNSSDPDALSKVVRVVLNCGQMTSSQAMIALKIQTVDDVTEVLVRERRRRYRPCPDDEVMPPRLAPLHEARLYDIDTQFFDGGSLTVELVSGGSKGDALSLLSRDQQEEQIRRLRGSRAGRRQTTRGAVDDEDEDDGAPPAAASAPAPAGESEALEIPDPQRLLFTYDEAQKLITFDDGVSCNVTFPKTAGIPGASDLKVHLQAPPQHPGGQRRVSIDHVSYILNCVIYANSEGKFKEGVRTYQVRVSDGINPQDGRTRISLDLRPPLVSVPQHAATVYADPGHALPIFSKLVVAQGEGGVLTVGSCTVEVISGLTSGRGGDALILSLKDGGFRIEGGALYQGPLLMGALVAAEPALIRLDFVSGGRMKQPQLAAFLKSVLFRVGSAAMMQTEAERAVPKVIRVSVAEDTTPRISQATVSVIASDGGEISMSMSVRPGDLNPSF